MTEYIRKQEAIDIVVFECGKWTGLAKEISKQLKQLPPADVVPVVRCGQCGYWHDNDGDYGYCYAKDGQGFGHAWRKNDFCSYGERKGIV